MQSKRHRCSLWQLYKVHTKYLSPPKVRLSRVQRLLSSLINMVEGWAFLFSYLLSISQLRFNWSIDVLRQELFYTLVRHYFHTIAQLHCYNRTVRIARKTIRLKKLHCTAHCVAHLCYICSTNALSTFTAATPRGLWREDIGSLISSAVMDMVLNHKTFRVAVAMSWVPVAAKLKQGGLEA